jgi:hypothetical protein
MADKANKANAKEQYLNLLHDAYKNAANAEGVNLNKSQIADLWDDLKATDATKVREWLALNKESLSRIPEVASQPAFLDVTENPKVVEKDYGFTESDDFYKMDGPKSWMNKSYAYLKNNADKYGLTIGEYLDKVRELSTKKEQERQWEDNYTLYKADNVPAIGDIRIPGPIPLAFPNSFNKASMGKEVDKGDIAFDLGLDAVDLATMASPLKYNPARTGGSKVLNMLLSDRGLAPTKAARIATSSPVVATTTNVGRQAKGIYDDTQDEFSLGQAALAGTVGSLGLPMVTHGAADAIKSIAGTASKTGPIRKFANAIEGLGEQSPSEILRNKVAEDAIKMERYKALQEANKASTQALKGEILKEVGKSTGDTKLMKIGDELYENNNPIAKNADEIYGKDSKLWRNVRDGEIYTQEEFDRAAEFMNEYNKGKNYPSSGSNQARFERAIKVKNEVPNGELLVNAWAEPKTYNLLRNKVKTGATALGGRYGMYISEDDKKAMAKNIVNSTEWAKYVTGLPNNLTEEQIYLATVYGE